MYSRLRLIAAACLLAGTALNARAASSAASEVSGSVSTSVGALSNSVGRSSDSSSRGRDVAAGDYRVIEMAAADARGLVRVRLQATSDSSVEGALFLTLPIAAVARGELAPGATVTARARPYGLEFTAAATRQAFFLALSDDWYRELDSRAVVL
jgi:hypothetical protein